MTPISSQLAPGKLLILLLHGVVKSNDCRVRNYTGKHLNADYFKEIMKDLKQHGTPLAVDDIVNCHQAGRYPDYAFSVTFDDGFENNYSVAAPILRELDIPACIYITTDWIEHNRMSWIDRIEYCCEKLDFISVPVPWKNELLKGGSDCQKIALLDEIRKQVKSDRNIDPEEFADGFLRHCGIDVIASDHPLDLKMSWEQVKDLESDPLFTIGAHTVSHTIMSFLSPEELESEVNLSLAMIQEKVGLKTQHYSYPEGMPHCYSQEVIQVLKKHGIICSPTAIPGVNDIGTDLFHLYRQEVS